MLGLQWARVDLGRKIVWVEAENMKGDEPIAIPLNARAIKILKDQLGANVVYVFPYRGRRIGGIETAFRAACVRANLGTLRRWTDAAGDHQEDRGFTCHGLRHTWATWQLQAETPLDVLQKLGSWSDLHMVMKHAHRSAKHLAHDADDDRRL